MKMIVKSITTLGKLPVGSLFIFGTTLCLKTEYRSENSSIDAYIVGSGEKFWGGTDNPVDQKALEVIEVSINGF